MIESQISIMPLHEHLQTSRDTTGDIMGNIKTPMKHTKFTIDESTKYLPSVNDLNFTKI